MTRATSLGLTVVLLSAFMKLGPCYICVLAGGAYHAAGISIVSSWEENYASITLYSGNHLPSHEL